MGDNLPHVKLGMGYLVGSLMDHGSAYFNYCVVLIDGRVKCWGYNYSGFADAPDYIQRGDDPGEMGDNMPFSDMGTGVRAKMLSGGAYHACAVMTDNRLKCWGLNNYGQLGIESGTSLGWSAGTIGDNIPYVNLGTGRTAKSVAAGTQTTCALLDNGTVKCWGYSGNGERGSGDTASTGSSVGQMGDNLPVVDLGTGRTAKKLSAGYDHACAVLDNDQLKCWGYNAYGQLGLGDTAARGDGPGEMGDSLPYVNLGTGRTVKDVQCGAYATCAILDNGGVKCWGYDGYGLSGAGTTATFGDAPGTMGDNAPYAQIGSGRTAQKISVGVYHVCAVLDDGSAKCWGYGGYGEVGSGSSTVSYTPSTVDPGTSGHKFVDVVTGEYSTCVLYDDGNTKCMGYNAYGQIGVGNVNPIGDDPTEAGDGLPFVQLGHND
jgi:alpha-tubulin suppressor-like RCC1 family protein